MKKYLETMALEKAVKRCQQAGIEGRFPAGPGLSCVVTAAGHARFVHRYPWQGKYQSLWLEGRYPRDISLAEARRQVEAQRAQLDERMDPREARKTGDKVNPTLAEYATRHFALLATPKDIKLGPEKSEWLRMMTHHTGALARTPIDSITFGQIKAAVEHRWIDGRPTPTAKTIIMRLKAVIRHRHVNTNADEERWWNPADFKALCDALGRREHFRDNRASLSWREMPAFMARLRQRQPLSARCLEWIILTGCRSNEATGARWQEIDWAERTWAIPPDRLKTEQRKGKRGKPFIVPLSLMMVQTLRRAMANRNDLKPTDLIFPSYHLNKPGRYKEQTILILARDIRPGAISEEDDRELSVHGFRSTLTAWGAGGPHRLRPPFALDLMDRCIGHNIGSKEGQQQAKLSAVIGSYAHDSGGDLYQIRRAVVMREWSAYLGGRAMPPMRGAQAMLALMAA